jgi:hypothetical protein
MPLVSVMNSYFYYLIFIPFIALAISLKIIINNITYSPMAVFLFPFIFLSKVAFRIGALDFIKTGRISEIMTVRQE